LFSPQHILSSTVGSRSLKMGKTVSAISCLLVVFGLIHGSEGQAFTIPGTSPEVGYTPTAADLAACPAQIMKFGAFFSATPPAEVANCRPASTAVVSDEDWAKFAAGFTASAVAGGYTFGANLAECIKLTPTAGGTDANQQLLCGFIDEVARSGAFCETLSCNTGVLNEDPTVAESVPCYGIGEKMCTQLAPAGANLFKEAVAAANATAAGLPVEFVYDTTTGAGVDPTSYTCDPAVLCLKPAATTGAPPTTEPAPTTTPTPSGGLGTSLVAAVVIGSASLLL